MWEQFPGREGAWRILAPDMRGHGDSDPVADGDYSFETLAADVVNVLDGLAVDRFGVVGISVGGEIAQVLAALYPHRVYKLLLSNTACLTTPARAEIWNSRIALAESKGMREISEESVARWFTPSFHQEHPEIVEFWKEAVARTSVPGYVGIARTIQRMDLAPILGRIKCPTLILSGELDSATGPRTCEEIARAIPGSIHRSIPGAGHLWNLESPEQFYDEVRRWIFSRSGS